MFKTSGRILGTGGLFLAVALAALGAEQNADSQLAKEMAGIRGANYIVRTGWSRFDLQLVRGDLAVAKALGFNSVRTFLDHREYKTDPGKFLKNLGDFLSACREHGLTAMPAINPDRRDFKGLTESLKNRPETLRNGNFPPYQYLHSLFTAFDKSFADVIICWDIWNEPFWDAMIDNDDMAMTREAVVWFARTAEALKPVNPFTIGWALLEDLLEDPELVDLTPVVSFHWYNPTMGGYVKKYRIARDLLERHGNRPMLQTELGRPGMLQPYSDAAGFCESNKIGYYMWEVFARGGWQRIQGLVFEDGGLRESAVPKWMAEKYRKRPMFLTEGYDLGVSGANVLDRTLDAALSALKGPKPDPRNQYEVLELLYNAYRVTSPRWTPDLRDVFLPFDDKTPQADVRKAFRTTLENLRPLIRTHGDHTNDNAMGGDVPIRYIDMWTRTSEIENIWETSIVRYLGLFRSLWPTVYVGDQGKGASKAAGNFSSQRILLEGWRYDADKPYLFEADVRPPKVDPLKNGSGENGAGLAINVRPGLESDCGVIVKITLPSSAADGVGMLFVERFTPANVKAVERLLAAKLKQDDFDRMGYAHLAVRFEGDSNMKGNVLVNGREMGAFKVSEIMGRGDRHLALEGNVDQVTSVGTLPSYFFDNVKVTEIATSKPVLSDSFEKYGTNGERLSYLVDQKVLDRLEALAAWLKGK